MGKNKLARWNEFGRFSNVIQPEIGEVSKKDHPVKGTWRSQVFKNNNPVILELGCGKGEYTTGLARIFPGNNYIGVDIKGARMWRGARTAHDMKLSNVAFLRTRIEFITSFFAAGEVDEIWITFPDPHPGGRNSNKRLTSPWFLNNYRLLLNNNGVIHLKTDNSELYEYTLKILTINKIDPIFFTEDLYGGSLKFENTSSLFKSLPDAPGGKNRFPEDILTIKTHYETQFLLKGMKINYLSFSLDKDKLLTDGSFRQENE